MNTWEQLLANTRRVGDCIYFGTRSNNTYGRMLVGGKNALVHRVAYELLVGPIPNGLVIDHLCGNKPCIAPWHLEAVTQAENARRYYAGQESCIRGHLFDTDNSYWYRGTRQCRACKAERARRYKREARERKANGGR